MAKDTKPKAQPEEEKQLLDLDELIEPSGTFKLGGKVYEFIEMGMLGLLEQKRIEKQWMHIQTLRKNTSITAKQEVEYTRTVRQLIPMISNMPKKIAQEQNPEKLLQAIMCFFSFRTASQVALIVRMSQLAGKSDTQIGGRLFPSLTDSGPNQTPASG